MRITCPSCRAVYDVPDQLLAPGRNVRCTACGHTWEPRAKSAAMPAPELEADADATRALAAPHPDIDPPPATRPLTVTPPLRSADPIAEWRAPESADSSHGPELVVPPRTPAAEPETPEGGSGAWIGWMATIAVLVLVAWAAYTWRAAVMQAWPPSQRAYVALGLAPTTPGPAHPAPTAPSTAPPQPSANPQQPPPSGKPAPPAQSQ